MLENKIQCRKSIWVRVLVVILVVQLKTEQPAETSNNSDICGFLKVSDIENSMVVNGKMYILKHSS